MKKIDPKEIEKFLATVEQNISIIREALKRMATEE